MQSCDRARSCSADYYQCVILMRKNKMFIGFSDAARYFGTSRQNVQQFLERTGRLEQCEKIEGETRTHTILIPARLLADAPFATGVSALPLGRPPKKN